MSAEEQERKIHGAIGCRAFQIFRSRKSAESHNLEDWSQAKSELVRPCCRGRMSLEIVLGTEKFQEHIQKAHEKVSHLKVDTESLTGTVTSITAARAM